MINLNTLSQEQVHGVATLTPLALSRGGKPAVVLLDLEAGEVVPPHATEAHSRLLTVLSGEVSWGDGETIVESEEKLYPAGSLLVIPAGDSHWLAARSGDVRLQLIVLDDEKTVPGITAQLK